MDSTAVNDTTYYYVVQSVNPTGTSGNSPQSAGTAPSGSVSTVPPAAPTSLSALPSQGTVALTWNPSSGAGFYTVQRSTVVNNGTGTYIRLGMIALSNTNTATSYTDTALTDGSTYEYNVTATSPAGTSSNSVAVRARPLPPPPASAPAGLTATPLQATNVVLNWSGVPGAVGYVLQRATTLNGTYSLLASITELAYTDYGISSNGTYYYKVAAVNAGGVSTNSITTTRPAALASLNAIPGNTRITLSWPASIGAIGYLIKRGTSSGNETNIVAASFPGTNYTDTNLFNGTRYYYVVASVGTAATSGNSPEASAIPAVPTPPTIASATLVTGGLGLSGSGGVPYSAYYVLAASNLVSAPWTHLATNHFDASGNFIYTNAINSNQPRLYFRLEVQ